MSHIFKQHTCAFKNFVCTLTLYNSFNNRMLAHMSNFLIEWLREQIYNGHLKFHSLLVPYDQAFTVSTSI